MERIFVAETVQYLNQQVKVAGWIHTRRDHGGLVFFDLRDRSGLLQVVVRPEVQEAYAGAQNVRSEWVVEIIGTVKERPQGMANPHLKTGTVELVGEFLKILNESQTPPFDLSLAPEKYEHIDEELRLKFRYLDLRRPDMYERIDLRHRLILFIRNFLHTHGFLEVETPILTRSTPEGARDFIVPSRLQTGKFYALPQSPQQYKQLLMVAGIERYFQVARCFRDEDTRGDRQPEFTQLDLEMSFVEREDIMALNEQLIIAMIQKTCPEKEIQDIPFPRLRYQDALAKYNTDRPDLRKDKNNPNLLAFLWVIDFPFFQKTEEDGWTFTHNPFSAPEPASMEYLLQRKNIEHILTTQYDLVLNGCEIAGGSIRNNKPEALAAVFDIIGVREDELQENFGHMLEAFTYGVPPHGGIAWGFDRLLMILAVQLNIREVIAFPKTGDARDPMMNTPADVFEGQLRELGITIRRSTKSRAPNNK